MIKLNAEKQENWDSFSCQQPFQKGGLFSLLVAYWFTIIS